jgi:hypothetical protein
MTPTSPRSPFLTPVRRLRILLCLLLALLISVEYLTRVMHGHRNATLAIESGIQQALQIRRDPNYRQLLFAGNSLIFDDLSEADLQQGMGPGYIVHTAGVPGSTYYDWRYGLHALFARGSRPDVLVFSISPSQFLRRPATTPLPVSTLWSAREIVAYHREQNIDLSMLSELLLEHYSTYFSLRDTVRIYARKVIPGYESMIYGWTRSTLGPQLNAGPETETLFSDRLSKLAAECGSHTRLMLIVPPTNQLEDEKLEPELKVAAEGLGIDVIEPVVEREWPLAKFREDGYHLTELAAAEFSKLVAADLRRKLAEPEGRVSGQ